MDDLIYRNNAIAEENIDRMVVRQRMNSRNSVKRSLSVQILGTRIRK